MLKSLFCVVSVLFAVSFASAQPELQKLVDTEKAFAAAGWEKGTPASFLEYMTDDALAFTPDVTNAKTFWSARKDSGGRIKWAPNYADISANGQMGYTTGNWEFFQKGDADKPTGYGQFVTVWTRQKDGNYKWALDIGIDHEKPAAYSTEWTTTALKTRDPNPDNSSAAETATGFQEILTKQGAAKAYKAYAAEDIRLYRDKKMPFIGKKAAMKQIENESKIVLDKKSSFLGSADLAYNVSRYSRVDKSGKTIESGNYVQIWKLIGGKWRIVLDLFKSVPAK
jgi:ketosteroid isomerase-like protein